MINLALLRQEPERIINLLQSKDPHCNIQELYTSDIKVRSLKQEVEHLRHQKNECAQRAKSGLTTDLREQSIFIGKQLKQKEQELTIVEEEFNKLLLACPNIPDEILPVGGPEHNKVVRIIGQKPVWNFEPKNHVELAMNLGWLDFQVAATMTASNFALYKKDAVGLLYALGLFMLKNNKDHGFEPILPPFLVNEESLTVSGNFPKFKDQAYHIPSDALYLTPTSEVNLVNIYRNTIIPAEQLPICMTALTSCFRREAGGYGAHERGLIRMHQFEKVELVTICQPENSKQELDRMIACAENILKKLNLHYRVSLLATQDTGFQSAKTYDIEVWLPGQKEYREVSSASTCTDFQARRGLIRYKPLEIEKPAYVHTLNASSLAIPRLMVALMETYQQEDGTITLPEILKSYWVF
ncbi:MAG TPA: serine--tRNA ligase [Candidatus Babeliales bacterium]|jgi:seryl-tRNA synthetase|nr:serine--tRNA ligase [Candidatus Babeliales bacterium]